MKIDIFNTAGKKIDSLELDQIVFDTKVNQPLMHQAVVAYLANQRKGLASTKTRGEVRGGGKKPWRQKGTGRARVGTIRSPLWRKGGITFGPKPHSYYKDLSKRMKIMALKSALNTKLRDNELLILNELNLPSHKTKGFAAIMERLKLDGRSTFVVESTNSNLCRSSRNIKDVVLVNAHSLTTYTTLDCKHLIFTQPALERVIGRIRTWLV